MTRDEMQKRNLKSFILVGHSFIDIKSTIGFSFYRDPDNYVGVQFIYDSGKALNAPLKNREEFSLFLLEVENFIDDEKALANINKFMDEIENLPIIPNENTNDEEYIRKVQEQLNNEYNEGLSNINKEYGMMDDSDFDSDNKYDDGYSDLPDLDDEDDDF